jgi:long-chain acyl-CoA synthetase
MESDDDETGRCLVNLANVFLDTVRKRPRQAAITFENRTFSYLDLASLLQQWSQFLKASISKGDRVLCISENRPEIMAIYLAVAGVGGVFVPVNPQLSQKEVDDIILRASHVLAITSYENAEKLNNTKHSIKQVSIEQYRVNPTFNIQNIENFIDFDDRDGCLICFTSGSTGRAKGVFASHLNEFTSSKQYAESWVVTDNDRLLITLPLSFVYGLTTGCLMGLLAGAHIILEKRFHPQIALERIRDHQVSVFMGVPTMYTMMLNVQENASHKYDISSVRLMLTAGAPIANEVLDRFYKELHIELTNFYALSEIRPICTFNVKNDQQFKRGSCGRIPDGVDVRLLDENGEDITIPGKVGELVAKSDTLMIQYYGDIDLTLDTIKNGWFYTGDLGMFDEEGFYYITGRKKDLVIRGGINISPVEIEEHLYKNPAILEVVVLGVPDEIFGEELLAQIVPKTDYRLEEEEIRLFLQENLASYKVPKYILIVPELPKNNSGKIDKKRVKSEWEQLELQQLN